MTTELWTLLGFAAVLLMTIIAQSMALSAKAGVGYTLSSRDREVDSPGVLLPRLGRAVGNAIEAMAIFAPLVLVAAVAGVSNDITVTAALVFLGVRVLHPLFYAIGAVPFRTLSWSVSLFALMAFAYGLVVVPGTL